MFLFYLCVHMYVKGVVQGLRRELVNVLSHSDNKVMQLTDELSDNFGLLLRTLQWISSRWKCQHRKSEIQPLLLKKKESSKRHFCAYSKIMCIQRDSDFSTTMGFSILFLNLISKVTLKPTSPMGHAICIYQKSFSTLLHCFMHEWYFIGFRICWSHLEDVFIFSSLELICFLHAVYLVLSLSQPSFQFIAYLYAYSYLSVFTKTPWKENHVRIFKKQIFLSLYKTGV